MAGLQVGETDTADLVVDLALKWHNNILRMLGNEYWIKEKVTKVIKSKNYLMLVQPCARAEALDIEATWPVSRSFIRSFASACCI